ncbi:hypothetical protein [Priestia koreensis]|uniref:hypothetical protein n=1 Tax=Priestia koreensis TaxID=284581 RepID=UPI0006A97080|nr:hypothetical protein [Priestia koreensis]
MAEFSDIMRELNNSRRNLIFVSSIHQQYFKAHKSMQQVADVYRKNGSTNLSNMIRQAHERNAYLTTLKPWNHVNSNMVDAINKMRSFDIQTLTVARQLRSIMTNHAHLQFSQIAKQANKLREALFESKDIIAKFKTIIIELGYPPHRDLSYQRMATIVEEYEQYGLDHVSEYIDEALSEEYNDKYLRSKLLKWEGNPFLKNRIGILRNVIRCHNLGMYEASIPTLMPQLEGLVAESFQHIGRMGGPKLLEFLKELFKPNPNEQDVENYHQAAYLYYQTQVLTGFEHGKSLDSEIGRNAILHGGDVEYGTRANSLKLILLFDYLLETIIDYHQESTSA